MHILLRGDTLQRLRLASGLVLFLFAATHLVNHAMGLVALEYMNAMQFWRKVVTRSWPGSIVLLCAFLIHVALALFKIARRRTWRMPPWEAVQIASGVTIPLLLIPHVAFNRGAATIAGTIDTYTYELSNSWPEFAWDYTALVVVMWVHATIGMHHWLRLSRWYAPVRPVLAAIAVALPVAAIAGFTVAGRQVADKLTAPGAHASLQTAALAPHGRALETLTMISNNGRLAFLALLAVALVVPMLRALRAATGPKVTIDYRGGPNVRSPTGATLLEISRAHGVPHTSVCGGRARCSTCRVGIDIGLEKLPPPSGAEAATLAAIGAPPHVRLACQIRPASDVGVTRLVPPHRPAHVRRTSPVEAAGVEHTMAVLFLDARGFTRLSENRLPYDVVFILNRLFGEVGTAILAHGGRIDKYMGDGLMALFDAADTNDTSHACRRAMAAARAVDLALDRLNGDLAGELGAPLRIGMGIEVGPLVLGEIGHPDSTSLTAIGSTVNTASRLEALSKDKECQLVVSARAMRLAGLDTTAFRHEVVVIRGLSEPCEIVCIPRARDVEV